MKKRCFFVITLLLIMVSGMVGCGSNINHIPDAGEESESAKEEKNTRIDQLEGKGLYVSVEFGYQKFVKEGRCARVLITIENTKKDFSGEVCMSFPSGSAQTVAYRKKIFAPSNQTKKYEMAVPINMGDDKILFSIQDEKGSTVLSKTIRVNIAYDETMMYVGVLTDDILKYSSFTGTNMKLFSLSKEEFPEDILSLDSLDVLLLDHFNRKDLTKKQREVLETFETKGTVLTVQKDWNIEKDLEREIEENLTDYTRERIEKEAYGYQGYYSAYSGTQIRGTNKIPSVFKYAIVIVCYLIIVGPPLYLILKKLDKPGALWIMVPTLSVICALAIYAMGEKTRQTDPYLGYLTIRGIGEETTKEEVLLTLTSPYNTGYEVLIPKEYAVTAADSDLGYAGNGVINSGITDNFSNEYHISIDWKQNGTKITVKDNAAFSSGYYRAETNRNEGVKLESNLHVSNTYEVTGTVTNTSGYDLTNACLCVGDSYIILGEIKDKETMVVDQCQQVNMASAVNLYSGKLLELLAGGNPKIRTVDVRTSRMYYAYQYYLEDRMSSFLKEDCVLVGFSKEEFSSNLFDGIPYHKEGISMVTLPVNADFSSEGMVFIPNIDRYMKAEDSYYYDTYRYMTNESMKFKIQFPKEDTIKRLIYSKALNNEFDKDSWDGFYGTIKAYNYITENYEVLFIGGVESTIENLDPYMDSNHTMSILMEANSSKANDKSITVPVLSALKEAN